MKSLDLHGIRHSKVDEKVRAFLNYVDLPCKVITGNSNQMKLIVQKLVIEYGWECHEESTYNSGTFIIVEKSHQKIYSIKLN